MAKVLKDEFEFFDRTGREQPGSRTVEVRGLIGFRLCFRGVRCHVPLGDNGEPAFTVHVNQIALFIIRTIG